MSLTTTIKTIQDIMRKDVGVDGDAQRIGQLVWMLFLKIFDEQEKQIEQKNKKYKSPLKDKYRWRNWAVATESKKEGDDLIVFVNSALFPALKNIATYQGKSQVRFVIQSIFEDAYNYMKSGTLLSQIIKKIEEEIPLESFEDQQHLGDVYEKLLRDLQSAGNAGEFYTPRAITQFIVDRIAPRLGETVLDPACGAPRGAIKQYLKGKETIRIDSSMPQYC